MDMDSMLIWIWNTAGESLRPFDGISEMNGNTVECKIWHCHGCDGELRTYWKPYQPWIKPNSENFQHTDGCKFLKLKLLLESAFDRTGKHPFYEFYESPDE